MPANPEIVIMLPRDRYAGLYQQWEKSISGLPTTTHARLRLMLLLRAGILARENLGIPGGGIETPAEIPEKRSRRKRKPKNAKLFYTIRCRVDPRMYPDVLDEWRALPRGSRSEMFAEYLRIGMKMTPNELRTTAQKVTRNIAWQPSTKRPEPADVAPPLVETMIVAGPPDTKATANAAAKLMENFQSLDD